MSLDLAVAAPSLVAHHVSPQATVTILNVTSGCYNVLGSVEDTKIGRAHV